MIEFGNTLRKAREAKGLTHADIANKTHMMIQQVVDLENENFTRIAAPIYGRGFVRLFCEQVGLDPKPMIEEFMDIINGNRDAVIRPRVPVAPESAPQPAPAPEPEPAPMPEPVPMPEPAPMPEPLTELASQPAPEPMPEPASAPLSEPVQEPVPEPMPEPAAETAPELPAVDTEPLQPAYAQPEETAAPVPQATDDFRLESVLVPHQPEATMETEVSAPLSGLDQQEEPSVRKSNVYVPPHPQRLSSPKPLGKKQIPNFKVPSSVWRIATLSISALLVLWVLFASIRAIYRLATTAPEPRNPSAQTKTTDYSDLPGAPGSEDKPEARKPLQIPALYID